MTGRVLSAVLFAAAASSLVVRAGGTPGLSQAGDQLLDGIGETALVARYVLDGTAEDASRNQLHAARRGSGGAFVDDELFRKVLLLTGDGGHLQLPGQALIGEDAVSVTAWL